MAANTHTDDVEPRAQCEACTTEHPISEMETVQHPGATLRFCQDCTKPPRSEMYGVTR